jgi:GNAT superfamily N-acetyltransferase
MSRLIQSTLSDLEKISECHKLCFANSFSTKAGTAYVRKTLEWFLAAENRFLFHIECDNKIIGYCGGFKSAYCGDGSTSGMLQYAMKEAIEGVIKKPYLLFHRELIKRYPLIFRNLLKKIFSAKKVSHQSIPHDNTNSSIGLVVIGVHPDYRGKKNFELLMQHFEEECKKRSASKATLSVKASNTRAIAAYKKSGWQIASKTENALDMFKILTN